MNSQHDIIAKQMSWVSPHPQEDPLSLGVTAPHLTHLPLHCTLSPVTSSPFPDDSCSGGHWSSPGPQPTTSSLGSLSLPWFRRFILTQWFFSRTKWLKLGQAEFSCLLLRLLGWAPPFVLSSFPPPLPSCSSCSSRLSFLSILYLLSLLLPLSCEI